MKYTLATVIVNYGTHDRTVQYVKEELPKCRLSQLIIIVNNGATERTTSYFVQELKANRIDNISQISGNNNEGNIYVIHNPENSGYAKGNNIGVRFVNNHFDVDYLLISNNDIVFQQDDVVEKLIDKLNELPDAAVIGPKVVGLDGKCQSPYWYIPFWREMLLYPFERFIPFLKLKRYSHDDATEGYYHHVMGCFFVIELKDYWECGMMDENTFLFYEEWILADRLNSIGKKEYYFPGARVLHNHGFSMSKMEKKLIRRDFYLESGLYYFRHYRNVGCVKIAVCNAVRLSFNLAINIFRMVKARCQ